MRPERRSRPGVDGGPKPPPPQNQRTLAERYPHKTAWRRVVEIHGEVVVGVHRPRDVNEYLREVGVDAPVVCFIGVSQGRTRHPDAKSHVIELAANRPETDFDVTKTLAERQLCKGQTKELIKAGKSSEFVIAVITGDAFVELVAREMVD